jgi:hypothetical protein
MHVGTVLTPPARARLELDARARGHPVGVRHQLANPLIEASRPAVADGLAHPRSLWYEQFAQKERLPAAV